MAEVPELNDLTMDSYSEEEFYADCSSGIKVDMNHLGWKTCISIESSCRSGITREIRKTRKPVPSIKTAIQLVVIIGRLSGRKGFQAECLFDDHDLLNHILVEEDISISKVDETCAVAPEFRYNSTKVHIIRDNRQKCLMLQEYQGNARLVALFLQGKNRDKEAKISMDSYKSTSSNRQTPVTLNIVGRNLYLSCKAEEADPSTPALSLMEVTNIREKETSDLRPFLFYRSVNDNSSNTFESVAFPGWYISTSQAENQFVQIKTQSDQVYIRDFQLHLPS